MNATTGIEWTDATSNPVKYRDKATGAVVWACVKKSPGCANCYSETLAKRYGRGGPFTRATMEGVEPFVCDKELRALLKSPKLTGKRVFVGDMTDVFGEWVNNEMLNRLFAAFALRPDVTFQVLTKRADRLAEFVGGKDRAWQVANWMAGGAMMPATYKDYSPPWPLPNVWLGVSVEDQTRADERIPLLLQTPAAVRFLSCEPLLGPVDLTAIGKTGRGDDIDCITGHRTTYGYKPASPSECAISVHMGIPTPRVDWVIVGGESGPDSRPCRVEWLASLRDQCKAACVPFFCKQLGSRVTTTLPAGETWPGHPGPSGPVQFSGDGFGNYLTLGLKSRKGGDMTEWPADLRVRQFPEPARA